MTARGRVTSSRRELTVEELRAIVKTTSDPREAWRVARGSSATPLSWMMFLRRLNAMDEAQVAAAAAVHILPRKLAGSGKARKS